MVRAARNLKMILLQMKGLKNFLETLRTPATAGAKSFSPKGVGCLRIRRLNELAGPSVWKNVKRWWDCKRYGIKVVILQR